MNKLLLHREMNGKPKIIPVDKYIGEIKKLYVTILDETVTTIEFDSKPGSIEIKLSLNMYTALCSWGNHALRGYNEDIMNTINPKKKDSEIKPDKKDAEVKPLIKREHEKDAA